VELRNNSNVIVGGARVARHMPGGTMKKQLTLFAIAGLLAALCAVPAWSQMSTVKGTALDEQGAPLTGGTVEMQNLENGQKASLKIDKKGQFASIAIVGGKYNIRLMKDGKQLYTLTTIPSAPATRT